MDGQQRTISICQYVAGDFAWGDLELGKKYFHRQPKDIQDKFLDYELMVYLCEGEEREKIDWFRTINIAGLELTEQEMRNAICPGPWVSDAKRYFSKPGCVAYKLGGKYLKGEVDRQAYLETAIQWIANTDKPKAVDGYMGIHQGDGEATELWLYFQKVINWVETIFPTYRKEMKGIDWGRLYVKYGERKYNPVKLDKEVAELMADKEVQRHGGIYEFLLSDRTLFEKLNLRGFDPDDMRVAYESQKGVCPICKGKFAFEEMRGDQRRPNHDPADKRHRRETAKGKRPEELGSHHCTSSLKPGLLSAKALCGNPGMVTPKAGTDKQEAKAIASTLIAKLYQITSMR